MAKSADGLEIQPRPKLDRPIATDRRDLPENRRRNRRRDASERAPVKRVQELGADLKFDVLAEAEVLLQSEILVDRSEAANARGACWQCRASERRGRNRCVLLRYVLFGELCVENSKLLLSNPEAPSSPGPMLSLLGPPFHTVAIGAEPLKVRGVPLK